MNDTDKEREVRWENYKITQFSFSINLFTTFAVASLAFAINRKLSADIAQNLCSLNLAIILWSISALRFQANH